MVKQRVPDSYMEKELVEQRSPIKSDFYPLVLDSIEDYAVFSTDIKGNVNSWNKGAGNLLGYTEKEIIGKNSRLFFTAADRKKGEDKKELKNALKDGRAIDERYHIRKDGTLFWASGKVFPIYDQQKQHIGFTKVMRNLQAHQLALEQLKEAEKYAESIIESAREPIIILNKDLTVNAANEAFYSLFKLDKNRTARAPIYQAGRGLFNIPKLAELLNLVSGSEATIDNFEFEHDWPSLGKKFFLINARNLWHPSGKSQLILFSVEDITEQKALEQQKDDFISIASHEIRTPITVIKAYAQMLKKRSEVVNDEFLQKTAQKVNEKAEKLMSLVTYLLDVSQIATGEMVIKRELFNITDLIQESIEELLLIDSHKFVVKGKVEEPVFADRFRISQVLNNLLNNASKYSKKESVINVLVRKNRKNDHLTVCVKDDGIGIPKQEQRHLFRRFWRASTAKAHNIGGIGLGLHISAEIIQQHQGKIWLKSEQDKGSAFYFSIPLNNPVGENLPQLNSN